MVTVLIAPWLVSVNMYLDNGTVVVKPESVAELSESLSIERGYQLDNLSGAYLKHIVGHKDIDLDMVLFEFASRVVQNSVEMPHEIAEAISGSDFWDTPCKI
jgi:hypothetical protein